MTVKTDIQLGKLFINGKFFKNLPEVTNEYFDVINPATEEVLTKVIQANEDQVYIAVSSAREAFEGEWSKVNGRQRAKYLYKIADLIERDLEEFATLETIDNGKPISETLNADLPLTIQCFRYYASLADKIDGRTIEVDGDFDVKVIKEPVGVVGQIIPWNFPLLMLAWKVAPALATGCTVVLKPAEQTPLTALRFAKTLIEAELPSGVVNIITGDGRVGEMLVNHPDIDKIAFTGSTEVGKLIGEACGRNLKRCSLELGGKAPNIVFPDVDIDKATDGVITSIFFNQGEVCCAGSRLFIHENIKEEFLSVLVKKTEALVQGDPLDPKTQVGSQISQEQRRKILEYIRNGIGQGAEVLTGGLNSKYFHPDSKGYFVKPTILLLEDDNICAKEEIFGVVLSVLTFNDIDDVVKRANHTTYGLSAGVWTKDIQIIKRLRKELKAGTVWVNCYNCFDASAPFGGFKSSGIGRELGTSALDLYTEEKTIWEA